MSEPISGAEVRSRRFGPAILVAGITVLLCAMHLVWLEHFRRGLPLDIDEAGYLTFALNDLDGWRHEG